MEAFGLTGFEKLRFERKCPVQGVKRGNPPNLDVLAEKDGFVLAIESKLIEYLTPAKRASIASSYDYAIETLAHPTWKEQIQRQRLTPAEFQYFSAGQIIKHYLGLRSCFPSTDVQLVYLFWEPTDRQMHPLFAQHRAEVESFAAGLNDPNVSFRSATYADLFTEWDVPDLSRHLRFLRARYELALWAPQRSRTQMS